MKSLLPFLVAVTVATAQEIRTDQPRVAADAIVATEQGGFVVVEAEDFFRQTLTTKRAWHITDATRQPSVGRDIDPPNHATASRGASIEVLPDEGNDGTPPIEGTSIAGQPGTMAVVAYRVQFTTPGRYYIWSRSFGTDGDDNTLHYGLDGTWPDTSARSHTFGGKKWQWANRHRQHKGKLYFEIPAAGVHEITLSMREDGCELDQFVLTTDESWTPPADQGFATPPIAREQAGLVVIEIESAPATDDWKLATETPGFTGTGYYEWQQVGEGKPAGRGVLRYAFRITTPGNYQFLWRNRLRDPANRPETLDPDGNDSWLRFVGGSDAPGEAPLGDKWKKIALLGHPAGWTWNTHADRGAPHPFTPVVRTFGAGDYAVEISGRSYKHALDRLVLRRVDGPAPKELADDDEARLTALPASPRS